MDGQIQPTQRRWQLVIFLIAPKSTFATMSGRPLKCFFSS